MTPLKLKANSSESIFDQVVFAATKAILSGALQVGDAFPSVRAMASDMKIHPNTAHKVIQHLIQERWLVSSPGKGTTVAMPPQARTGDRQRFLNQQVEHLVVEAPRVGASLDEVQKSIKTQWKSLDVADDR
jgi:GntR family transcriptional regulator